MLISLLAWTCSATSRAKGHKALAKKAAPNFNKGLAKNADAASAIAEELARSQLSAVVAPPSCDGPCVRALSSDFDLRHAFTSGDVSPALWSESVRGRGQHDSRLSAQLRLYEQLGGAIKPVPAGCVMRALDRLTPGAVTRPPNMDAAACGAYQRHSLDALSVAALKTIDAQFAASKTVGGLLGRIFG